MSVAMAIPRYRQVRSFQGLGAVSPAAQEAQQIGSITGQFATGVVSALQLANVIALSSTWVPLIGPVIAAVTAGIAAILNSGCGQSCIVTSNWANRAEQLLIQNIQGYFALPTPRAQSAQAVALANFDNVKNYLIQECSQPGLGTAGVNCIQDRFGGTCKWRQTTTSPLLQYPGEPQPGECWDWILGYRTPIANDPYVVPDSQATPAGNTQTTAGSSTGSTFGASDLALYAGIGLLAWGLLEGAQG